MKKRSLIFFLSALLLLLPLGMTVHAEAPHQKQFVYDYAQLLTDNEVAELEALASELGAERETAFIIITANGTDGKDIDQYVGDFYDEQAPGYNQPHGNTAILTIDLQERDVKLAGFKKAEDYLDDQRMNQIRNKITPALSDGQYFEAFSSFIHTSHDYMGYKPGVNPENVLFKWWFQLLVSIIVAGVIVTLMAYRSGGRVTVSARTYMDSNNSRIISKHDRYVRKTVTKRKKPTNNNKSGGGGGGITGGGHSHSGSRGKF
ncbi:TPM domain-containing protein [Sutcliffiella halmapala]|uniref:TPM domain-containing protein n=1 Tax=Sutcliffiella halmapala TaxID=79882 RepID=UPI000994E09F|nr:TPM domain-containing protein [Sutcliffiella halmapala]